MKHFAERAFLFFFLFCLYWTNGRAQLESPMSQYLLLPSTFNPAMVGESGKIQMAGVQRLDFLAFASGGQATNFTINLPLTTGSFSHGVGLRFVNWKAGSIYSSQNAYLQYALKRKLAWGRLSVGVDLGFVNIAMSGSKVKIPETSEYHKNDDAKIPKTDVAGMALDLNVGAAYFYDNFYFGASFSHLNAPLVDISDGMNKQRVAGILYLHALYRYALQGTKLEFYPSTLFKTYFSNLDLDLGVRCVYDEKYWGGLSFRILNSVVFSAGMNMGYGISAGLAYDLPTTRMIAGFGSLELFLEYGIERISNKQKKKYKSVRIL